MLEAFIPLFIYLLIQQTIYWASTIYQLLYSYLDPSWEDNKWMNM